MSKTGYCENCKCQREITIEERPAKYTFRREPFEIIEKYAKCTVCNDDIYDEETANQTLQQLSQLYKSKHSFTAEDVRNIRKATGLTQSQFAKVLNMGEATIKRYESGASLPDATQLGLLKILQNNPSLILRFYEENKNRLTDSEVHLIYEKLQNLTFGSLEKSAYDILWLIYSKYEQKIENGYSTFNPKKLFHMILFFAREGVLKTKLMKLLWYSDFLMFKRHNYSISGTPYWHMPLGPVPVEHDTVLGCGNGLNIISTKEEEDVATGYTKMVIKSNVQFNERFFNEDEIKTLCDVQNFFITYGSRAISNFSHNEEGWRQTKDEQVIPYSFASNLQLN